MGKIEKILKKGPVEGQTTEVYPVTSTKAVYDENNKRLDNIITGLQESVYLNTPIPISTDNTTESMAQNVKNIADYVKKAKAAGIENVDGMEVTCLINEDYSAVGYLYGEDVFVGILLCDDNSLYYVLISSNGSYVESSVVIEEASSQVTSNMLVQGARRPIIFTPDTTEVDEETYQKLLSDDVDVVFKASGEYCSLTYKYDGDTDCNFYFTVLSAEGGSLGEVYLYGYNVSINHTAPHKAGISTLFEMDIHTLIDNSGFINKSILSPVLQEIDLTGTDADRKAKLDQFEADWKALTGASNLTGARFLGYYQTDKIDDCRAIFSYNIDSGEYTAIIDGGHDTPLDRMIVVPDTGSITITQLFSHLEAITIQTLNIPANKKKNIDAIQAYVNNLAGIGVDVTKGYTIPIKTVGFENGVGVIYPNTPVDKSYKGICIANGHSYIITISQDGTWDKQNLLDTGSDYTILNTSAKDILGAINEINTLTNNKQDTLTSGTNIKTINNQSLLGSGNIEISAPSITADTTMSDTSTNPVQNKVIKAYIDGLVGNVATQLAQI